MKSVSRLKIAALLILLLLTSCTAAVGYFSSPRSVLSRVGVVALLQHIGVVADPELQAKIVDLSKQIEDLQRMVTLLIPEQQQRIEQIQQLQIEQQQKQVEQERREAEQREEERRRKEEERKREEEEKRREKEQEKARELDKIRQLEEQKSQLELELKLEEERRKEKEKEEEEEEKQKTEKQKTEEDEGEEEGELVVKSCGSSEDQVYCEAEEPREKLYTAPDITENGSAETGRENFEEWDALLIGLQEEKIRLKEEMADWENFKSRTIRASQRRNKAANLLLSEVKDKENKEMEEQGTAISQALLTKLEQLELDNTRLRELLEQIEARYTEQVQGIVVELEGVKKQLAEEDDPDATSTSTNSAAVQELIDKSLELFAADRVGMPDYALESSGAVVFTIGDTEPYTRDTPWMGLFGISIWRSCKTPRLAIQKDNSPGNCWSFTGTKGTLTVQLSAQVFPEHFTMDHIPRELAPNRNASSAPSHFRVLGLDYGNAPKGHVLGNYQFTNFPIQTFAVQQNPYEKYFRFIRVEILSNHGNKDYTCLYRFRVHGTPYDTETFNG